MTSARDQLHGDRLTLEPLAAGHAADWYAALGDPLVGRYIGGPDVVSVDDAARVIGARLAGPQAPWARPGERWWNFMVRLRGDTGTTDGGVVIGRAEATTYAGRDHHPYGEIAYLLGPTWWGRGYATEATAMLMAVLRRDGIGDLWAAVVPDNASSIAVLDRLGFVAADADGAPHLGSCDPGDLVFCHRG